ncbi:MAG: lipoyl(octanoyl) transferase LipB [Odoribacteraceae bacterium]|jgi:lipoyl(octanoyl) transferase|nr:lipoyl(octanoyl) transferase LipB [Odoribacteraceae bacterium]
MKGQVVYTDLGVMEYLAAWERQRDVARAVMERPGDGPAGHVLFVEHPRVYTLGRNGNEANMLERGDVPLVKVDRGGDITYHGPGQLVVYPILDLAALGLGARAYVAGLEEVVIRVTRHHGIVGERLPGATGVWIAPGGANARKICAIGIKCARHVTMHGLALNVNTELDYFSRIHPCGFTDKGVTSMARELGRAVAMEGVKAVLKDAFESVFLPREGSRG